MANFVLSTIGTSILTNQITNSDPHEWRPLLNDSANCKTDELDSDTQTVIDTLANRALSKLREDNTQINRRISAELNGIYSIYEGTLPRNSFDEHYLICTDTAQGQKAGELIRGFLAGQGFGVFIYTPQEFSTRDTAAFSTGIKNLIGWLDGEEVQNRVERYHVIFNLVGGFKSLQGYMNTFGAFYADEIIYIFEAPTADLITIPRLPIQIDTGVIQEHRTEFALMAAGKLYPRRELSGIPEALLEFLEEGDEETDTGLSVWGTLVWNRSKLKLLRENLLKFPRLDFERTFHDDFNGENNARARLRLQETLAKVAYILDRDGGHTRGLIGGGLRYKQLQGWAGIHTFRVSQSHRVSCTVTRGGLSLRRYGHRNTVNGNP